MLGKEVREMIDAITIYTDDVVGKWYNNEINVTKISDTLILFEKGTSNAIYDIKHDRVIVINDLISSSTIESLITLAKEELVREALKNETHVDCIEDLNWMMDYWGYGPQIFVESMTMGTDGQRIIKCNHGIELVWSSVFNKWEIIRG